MGLPANQGLSRLLELKFGAEPASLSTAAPILAFTCRFFSVFFFLLSGLCFQKIMKPLVFRLLRRRKRIEHTRKFAWEGKNWTFDCVNFTRLVKISTGEKP